MDAEGAKYEGVGLCTKRQSLSTSDCIDITSVWGI
jgi:hypothetical protein